VSLICVVKGSQRTLKTTSHGESVTYAQERLLTIGWLSRMLRQVGFASVWSQLSVFFPPSLASYPALLSVCARLDAVLNKVPALRNVGGIYTLVASK
jgi:hypothetical protein